MKTLLQINSVINAESTGRIVEEIGQTAIAAGWQSYIAYGMRERYSQSQKIRIGSDWDIKLHGLQTRLLDNHSIGMSSRRATRKLIDQIKLIKPDVIHLHNLHGYFLNIEELFKYLKYNNIPVIWTFHDCWPFTGHCAHFDFIGCQKWKNACHHCPLKTSYPASWFIDRSVKNYWEKKILFNSVKNMTIVPVSNWLGNLVSQSFLSNYPVKVINNGINAELFQQKSSENIRKKYNLENKFILLGVTNQWTNRKGLLDFIKLSSELNNEYTIILVGLTKKQINKLPNSIIGVERTESVKKLADFYASADIYINPTYEDNFPTTNLEALACGTPVITYETGGSPEAIDANTGLVIGKGNFKALVSAIQQIKSNGKTHYSFACRERVLNFYLKEDRYKEYLELYDKVLIKADKINEYEDARH